MAMWPIISLRQRHSCPRDRTAARRSGSSPAKTTPIVNSSTPRAPFVASSAITVNACAPSVSSIASATVHCTLSTSPHCRTAPVVTSSPTMSAAVTPVSGLNVTSVEDKPWGTHKFTSSDPSGNNIRVGRNVTDDESGAS